MHIGLGEGLGATLSLVKQTPSLMFSSIRASVSQRGNRSVVSVPPQGRISARSYQPCKGVPIAGCNPVRAEAWMTIHAVASLGLGLLARSELMGAPVLSHAQWSCLL